MIETKTTQSFVTQYWDDHIVPTLKEYIAIPALSPAFDPNWEENGYMEEALQLALKWLESHKPKDSVVTVERSSGRTPLILVDVPGSVEGNILMYGHMDKQPEMEGWRSDLGPWKPVMEGEKLYGRGGADDGYALFASVCALTALNEQGASYPRTLILIEFSEESGSPDLPYYMEQCAPQIGTPDLIICLDSGAGNYDQFWCTTSLRGMVGVTMKVDVLNEGVHSGDASGIVPSSFRVARMLLERLEDTKTGVVFPEVLNVDIPKRRREQADAASETLGDDVFTKFPFVEDMKPANRK